MYLWLQLLILILPPYPRSNYYYWFDSFSSKPLYAFINECISRKKHHLKFPHKKKDVQFFNLLSAFNANKLCCIFFTWRFLFNYCMLIHSMYLSHCFWSFPFWWTFKLFSLSPYIYTHTSFTEHGNALIVLIPFEKYLGVNLNL